MINRKKILFITPPYHSGVVESAGRWMPLSFVYLAGSAREAGYETEIYDAMTKQHTLGDIQQKLETTDADILAMTAITSSFPASIDVLKLAKKINPKITAILGGVHPTFCYEAILDEHPDCVDFIIRGEGENTLKNLLTAIERNNSIDKTNGLAYKANGSIIVTKPQPFIDDLDSLPTAWDLIDWKDYNYFVIPNSRLAAISTSRGCTFGCTFCSQQKFWNKTWRGRNPENVVAEIEMLHKNYAANVFLIVDEYPTSDRNRWENFLDRLIQKNLDIYLLMETRVEDIVRDKDILWKYRKAGIVHIYIGVEATNQDTLDLIKKDVNVSLSKEAIDLIREHRMISETSFVLGFPWETKETIKKTLELAQHYNPDFAHFLAITPWTYADMYEEMKNHIEVWDYSKYNLVEPIIKPNSMTLEEIRSAMVDCYKKYYSRKALDYIGEKDIFKRDYLLRSTKLIMMNSFLTQYLKAGNSENGGSLFPSSVAKLIKEII
ncbi:MAG: cobalamin-dependent protein [Bacteroidota bacterium]|nr:cobalamin-dependent protein [Bacteroidota bacterium]